VAVGFRRRGRTGSRRTGRTAPSAWCEIRVFASGPQTPSRDGYPDEIDWTFVKPDPDAEVRAVEHGGVDVAARLVTPSLARRQLDALAVSRPGRLHVTPTALTVVFFLNTRLPPFTDVRVRRAVNEAVDRARLTRLLGPGFSATCQILPPDFPSYRRTCPYATGRSGRLERARRIVRAAGVAGTPAPCGSPRRSGPSAGTWSRC
jgi:peptide/nickel transport system substrate-binding protein